MAGRYVIYGAGAIGGVLGARLHEHGRDVTLIARGAHLEAVRSDGLRMETPDGPVVSRIPAVGNPAEAEIRTGDVVVLAMKGQDTGEALEQLRTVALRDVTVMCTQNGVENERMALRLFPRVYGVRVSIPASHLEPGVVLAHGSPSTGIIDLGCYPHGADERAAEISGELQKATFDSRVYPDIMRWKYCKLLGNLGNAVEAVCEPGEHVRSGRLTRLARDEGMACLRAAGIDFATDDEDRDRRRGVFTLAEVGGQPHVGASSWQSLRRGSGRIETDFLNGEIVLLGRLHGVATPVNETLTRLAVGLAHDHRGPGAYSEEEVLSLAGAGA
ncbi:MAG: ketopantoate reductase family protein [Acidimicrobiales bacterium]|nr:ketopantoate reductase family protein [Acidimicrobiales bacterium]